MVVELAAFAFLGLAILRRWSGSPNMALAMGGWTATYVGVFYAGLLVTSHWTWMHTVLVAGTMTLIGMTISSHKALHLTRPAQATEPRS